MRFGTVEAGWDYWKDDVKYAAYFLGLPLLVCTAYGCSIRPAMVLPGQMEFMWEYAAGAIFQSAILYHAYKRDSLATTLISDRVGERIKSCADVFIHAAGLSAGDVVRAVWEHVVQYGAGHRMPKASE